MMRLDFDPADPEEHQSFLEARNELVARFERSAGGAGLGHVAEQVLDFKFGYLDGDLGDWDDEDVEVVLLDLYPAKALLDEEDLGEVVAGFAALLRFLAGEGLLAAGAAEGERLARGVDVLEPRFRAAMADESLWAPGKRILAAMRAEGVDPTDRDATDRWISDFNALPIEARDAVLGPLPGGPPRGGRDVGVRLPPVTLPPIDELAAAAAGSVQLRRLVRLVEFVGEGRPLTDRGNLKLADGKALVELLGTGDRVDEQIGDRVFRTRSSGELTGVDLTFRVAVESGVLAVEGRKVVPGPNAHRLADEPHEALYGAWLALVHGVGPTRHHFRRHRYHFDWYAEVLDESLPTMQLDLYREGAPVDIEELADEAWDRIEEQFDLDRVSEARRDQERESVGYSLRKALDRLEELGIVSLAGVVEVTTPYGFTRAAGGPPPSPRWAGGPCTASSPGSPRLRSSGICATSRRASCWNGPPTGPRPRPRRRSTRGSTTRGSEPPTCWSGRCRTWARRREGWGSGLSCGWVRRRPARSPASTRIPRSRRTPRSGGSTRCSRTPTRWTPAATRSASCGCSTPCSTCGDPTPSPRGSRPPPARPARVACSTPPGGSGDPRPRPSSPRSAGTTPTRRSPRPPARRSSSTGAARRERCGQSGMRRDPPRTKIATAGSSPVFATR
ncbi:MAG: hypothetical protein M5U14_20190 [Acidimicrobiia bacterium]|nr:hypothetical protein [Acidimicrobiia bacterium]